MLKKTQKQIIELLLSFLQKGIPITSRPFYKIAQKIGCSENKVIFYIKKLLKEKIIRDISPIFNSDKLNYKSALVAAKYKKNKFKQLVKKINKCDGVSHNYIRKGEIKKVDYNLWWTLTLSSNKQIIDFLENLKKENLIEDYLFLPMIKKYKIRAVFDEKEIDTGQLYKEYNKPLKNIEKYIKIIQNQLPIKKRPFLELANRYNISERKLLLAIRYLLSKRIIRRYSAVLKHRNIGYKYNGMFIALIKDKKKLEIAASDLIKNKNITHCYERKAYRNKWEYNLYAMIHCKTKKECLKIVEGFCKKYNIKKYNILVSTKELKKQRVKLKNLS